MTTIYLSSTYEDLKDYRKAIFDALSKVSHYKVIAMENYVATDKRPVEKCLQDVAKSDLYIGLFGFRYGYIPPAEHNNPDGLSITELEFRHALNLAKPYLIFVAKTDAERLNLELIDAITGDGNKGQKIEGLRNFLCKECMATFFSSPYKLASDVQAAIAEKLEELKPFRPFRGELIEKAEPGPTITWDIEKKGSPYPGLMHFTRKFAPVFFGRETEVREILDRLYAPEGRFIIISGNSGSGKSSLVDAGILPQLEKNGLPNGKSCLCLRMTPTQDTYPSEALANVLHPFAIKAARNPKHLSETLMAGAKRFGQEIQAIVTDGTDRDELVIFLDQMEELFIPGSKGKGKENSTGFLSSLYQATQESPLRVIATLRGDFLDHCHHHPEMLEVLKGPGHYPLGPLPLDRLGVIIKEPARCAGLKIPASLVRCLAQETNSDPGNLPYLAFVLEELFKKRDGKTFTEKAFKEFNGLRGAIEKHIEMVERELTEKLGDQALVQLKRLFQTLLIINFEGQPSRRFVKKIELEPELQDLADDLVKKRLLSTGGEGEKSTLSLSHEKLFDAWPTLREWIIENRDDLLMLRRAELDARDWEKSGYALKYLWHTDRLEKLPAIIDQFKLYDISPSVHQYSKPQDKLIESLKDETLSHEERSLIGTRLAELGDKRPGVGLTPEGLPDIDWVEIASGQIILDEEEDTLNIADFQIARYPVTHKQFQAFIEAKEGYSNPKWWQGIQRTNASQAPNWKETNCPRETVSWCEAVAFCRWMTHKYRDWGRLEQGKEIRLPTEGEWQLAATGGQSGNEYPWGADWNASNCNNVQAGLCRTIAVGMYPDGTWPNGPLDMCGNVWEWCQNSENDLNTLPTQSINQPVVIRVIRGGSWDDGPLCTSLTYRYRAYLTTRRSARVGFRLLKIK